MHDDSQLVENRLRRVLGERIEPTVYGPAVPLRLESWTAPDEPVPVAEGIGATYAPAQVGDRWGAPWATTWFHVTGQVPAEFAGRAVEVVVDLGFHPDRTGFHAEGLVYTPDGQPVKGLHPQSQWVRVADPATGGETVDLYIEGASNPLLLGGGGYAFAPTPLGDKSTAGDEPLYRITRAEIAVFNREVWELVRDFEVLGQLMHELPTDSTRRWELIRTVDRALDAVVLDDIVGSAAEARAVLAPALEAPAAASAHRLSAVGHAHIDSAWLWPVRETVRKVARTTANVTELMEHDDELVYAMSSAQQFAWIAEHRPEVFAKVKRAVESGRFVPVGGMWVESDTNMPGGEAMARQFVYGKRYFLDEFGIDTPEVWLPDSFGYTAALPQLVKLSGSQWFLTQKISWNQTNKFPHHTFWWEGIDGTRAFTHFPPVDTYNSVISGQELAHAARNFADKGSSSRSLLPFGYGDGGGGPTREMLARARRTANLDGSARVTIEKPADFFAAAEAEYTDAPVWVGELYLEFHRGTYTSQARTKQGNRRSEALLREAELWSATAAVRTGAAYPYEVLDNAWRTVLLNQFHDILPGSSIAWVYHQAEAEYAQVAADLGTAIDAATTALVSPADDGATTVFNAAPHGRNRVAALSAASSVDTSTSATVSGSAADGFVLDNGVVRAEVDGHGHLTSVVDTRSGRNAIAPGRVGNLLQLHQDLPNAWDAWEIESFYRNRVTDLTDVTSITSSTDGGVASVRVERAFSGSTSVQTISVEPGSDRVDVEITVDWHEAEKMLKVAFPLDLRADRSAAETQFGHVFRPTHRNTSWDEARFEICAHRFLHVAEAGYGVALVNDSTYGHDVTTDVRDDDGGTTTTVRLSLLRAPRSPDPHADQGEHTLRYAIVPGAEIVDAVREGYAINLPPRTVAGRGEVEPLVTVADDGVVVEAVKLADDRSGDVVVRLYEAAGRRTSTRVGLGFPVGTVTEVDLLERPLPGAATVSRDGDTAALDFRPFQIRTLRLTRS